MSPIGTILSLWEKCSIWLVKLTITSAADNQGTTYLSNNPSQEQAAKESAWVTLLNQSKTSPLGCWTASLHPSQPISPLQDTVSKGLWSAPSEHLSLSPVPSTSLLCWNHNTAEAMKSLGRSRSLFLTRKEWTAPNAVFRRDTHGFMRNDYKTGSITTFSFTHRHQT